MSTDELRGKLKEAEERGRLAGVREALECCRSQVYDEQAAKHDTYRDGQRRGALDCVSVVGRLLETLPPKQGVNEEWSGWGGVGYLGVLSSHDQYPYLLQTELEKGRWQWAVWRLGKILVQGDVVTALQAEDAAMEAARSLKAASADKENT